MNNEVNEELLAQLKNMSPEDIQSLLQQAFKGEHGSPLQGDEIQSLLQMLAPNQENEAEKSEQKNETACFQTPIN